MADCHIGSWRDPKLREISTEAFSKSVDICIERKVDFVLISGDFFNTSLPSIDRLKVAVNKLRQLKENWIPVYIIPGSHDFSPSGKTMLDVLEEAGLMINVVKGSIVDERLRLSFTIDKKTGAKITGILGKRGMLDRHYYEALDKEPLEREEGFKIFMFHTAIEEFKPSDFEGINVSPLSTLPKNFNYYAGGHVHYVFSRKVEDYGLISYPGPLFPNSFKELEELGCGGFYIYEDGNLERVKIELLKTLHLSFSCSGKNPKQVNDMVMTRIESEDIKDKLITLRFYGKIVDGKISEIDFGHIFSEIAKKRPYLAVKNTNALSSDEFEDMKVEMGSADEIEERAVKEQSSGLSLFSDEAEMLQKLINTFNTEKKEGERQIDFEERIVKEASETLNL
jgi:DNA repair exonuclease SbcCD nuclease subunit